MWDKVPRGAGANGGEPDRVSAAERRAANAERAAEHALELAERAERRADEAARGAAAPAERPSAERAVPPGAASSSPVEHYDELGAEEVIALLGSLEPADLRTLREYELQNANRARVLSAIDARISHGETPV